MIDLKSSQNNIEVVKARQTLIRILISCYVSYILEFSNTKEMANNLFRFL